MEEVSKEDIVQQVQDAPVLETVFCAIGTIEGTAPDGSTITSLLLSVACKSDLSDMVGLVIPGDVGASVGQRMIELASMCTVSTTMQVQQVSHEDEEVVRH